MKKTLIILSIMALATFTQAATIKWTVAGNATYVINGVDNKPYANQFVYLISAADVSSLSTAQTKDAFYDALADLTIETAKSAADGTKPTVSNLEVSSSTLMTAGTQMTFGVLLVSEDSSNGYYKLFTTNGTPFADDAPATSRNARISTAWAATGIDKGAWTKSYAVPEPSVALMGLLGLGMLIKRRRA